MKKIAAWGLAAALVVTAAFVWLLVRPAKRPERKLQRAAAAE